MPSQYDNKHFFKWALFLLAYLFLKVESIFALFTPVPSIANGT